MRLRNFLLIEAGCFGALALVLAVLWPAWAQAQTPTPTAEPTPWPNVSLRSTLGVYPIFCMTPADLDLAQLCFARVDLAGEPLKLGCVEAVEPGTRYQGEIELETTPGSDAHVKCYVVDAELNEGNLSDNWGYSDFTAPGKPRVVPGGVVSLGRLTRELLAMQREPPPPLPPN